MKMRKDQKVAVGYPYATQMSSRFHHSLSKLMVRDVAMSGRIVDLIANSSGANITNARNEIVAGFLSHESQPDWLWFIDTDMVFDADVLDRLVEAAHPTLRPIVGALCFSLQKGSFCRPTLYTLRGDGKVGVMWDYPAEALMELDATGTGCLLIHRTVFERMSESGKFPAAYPWFQETAIGGLPVGEDVSFCIRARACGFPVHVDTRVKVGHEKTMVLTEDVYLAQRQAQMVEPPAEPTFVVIPVKAGERYEMTAALVSSLGGQVPPEHILLDESESTITDKWNDGLRWAAEMSAGEPHNVAILNNDLQVPPDFVAKLARGLRAHDDIWLAYPDCTDSVPDGQVAQGENPQMAGQTMTGWAFMVRGEAGLRFDEQFRWWYGDSDIEKQVRAAGKFCAAVGGCSAVHLHPMESSRSPELLTMIREDERRFAVKWDLDPESLWLAQNPGFGAVPVAS